LFYVIYGSYYLGYPKKKKELEQMKKTKEKRKRKRNKINAP